MQAGLQVFLDDGTVQISDSDIIYSLVQKGTLSGTPTPEWGPSSALYFEYTFNVPPSANPVLALSGANPCWCARVSSTASSVTYRIYTTSSTSGITYYLFTTAPPPSGNYFEIYDESGTRLFSAESKPVRPLGVFSNGEYSGIPLAGREIAFIPQKMAFTHYTQVTYGSYGSCLSGGSIPGYQHYWAEQWQATALRCHSSVGIEATARTANISFPYICSTQPRPMYNSSQSVGHMALIIDVTNY